MSDGPHDPSAQGLSSESLSLLKSAAAPRAMTAAERNVAMQSVAKIAATPAVAAGGFTAAKLALATVTTVGAAAALARAVTPAPSHTTATTTIAAPAPAARPRSNAEPPRARPATPIVAAPNAERAPSPAPATPPIIAAPSTAPTLALRPATARSEAPVQAAPVVVRPAVAQPPSALPGLAGSVVGAHSLSGGTLIEPPERRETAALEQVFTVASSDPSRAMAMLDAFDREFPRGRLRDEREFLGVLVLDRLGRREEAQTRARAMLERTPGGMYAPRLRRLLERAP